MLLIKKLANALIRQPKVTNLSHHSVFVKVSNHSSFFQTQTLYHQGQLQTPLIEKLVKVFIDQLVEKNIEIFQILKQQMVHSKYHASLFKSLHSPKSASIKQSPKSWLKFPMMMIWVRHRPFLSQRTREKGACISLITHESRVTPSFNLNTSCRCKVHLPWAFSPSISRIIWMKLKSVLPPSLSRKKSPYRMQSRIGYYWCCLTCKRM